MQQKFEYDAYRLVWDVINEAVALREYATAEEREKLDFTTLDSTDKTRCIYGQMTGDCHSTRALELIQQSTTRYFSGAALSVYASVDRITQFVNGVYVPDFIKERKSEFYAHFSAIEVFINLEPIYPFQVESLVKYLRGESDDLNVYIF